MGRPEANEASSWSTLSSLPTAVKVVLAGGVVNLFGSGLVVPFSALYLRQAAHLSLTQAGAMIGVFAFAGLVALPVSGALADHYGPKVALVLALVVSIFGFGGYIFVTSVPTALLASTVAGFGDGGFRSPLSVFYSAAVAPEHRPMVFAAYRAGSNAGLALGTFVGGMLAVRGNLGSYRQLFVLDVVTFVLFGLVLWAQHFPAVSQRAKAGTFRQVLSNSWFRWMLLLDCLVAVAFAVAFDLAPLHAGALLGISNRWIGIILGLSSVAVVGCQFPALQLLKGRNRMRTYGWMNIAFAAITASIAIAWPLSQSGRILVVGFAVCAAGAIETVYGAIRPSITTELFEPQMHGRAFSCANIAFVLGQIGTRSLGGFLLDRSPILPWLLFGGALLLAAAISWRLEATIPAASRFNP